MENKKLSVAKERVTSCDEKYPSRLFPANNMPVAKMADTSIGEKTAIVCSPAEIKTDGEELSYFTANEKDCVRLFLGSNIAGGVHKGYFNGALGRRFKAGIPLRGLAQLGEQKQKDTLAVCSPATNTRR